MNTRTTIAYTNGIITLEKNVGMGGVWYRLTMPCRFGKSVGISFDSYTMAMRHVAMKTEDIAALISADL